MLLGLLILTFTLPLQGMESVKSLKDMLYANNLSPEIITKIAQGFHPGMPYERKVLKTTMNTHEYARFLEKMYAHDRFEGRLFFNTEFPPSSHKLDLNLSPSFSIHEKLSRYLTHIQHQVFDARYKIAHLHARITSFRIKPLAEWEDLAKVYGELLEAHHDLSNSLKNECVVEQLLGKAQGDKRAVAYLQIAQEKLLLAKAIADECAGTFLPDSDTILYPADKVRMHEGILEMLGFAGYALEAAGGDQASCLAAHNTEEFVQETETLLLEEKSELLEFAQEEELEELAALLVEEEEEEEYETAHAVIEEERS